MKTTAPKKNKTSLIILIAMLAILATIMYRELNPAPVVSEILLDTKNAQAKKFLFIGNSLTYVNQLPLVLTSMAIQSGVANELKVAQVVQGGATLKLLYEHSSANSTIRTEGPWTDVVLQEQSSVSNPQNTELFSEKFAQSIHEAHAHVWIFETWSHKDQTADQHRVSLLSQAIAKQCGGQAVLAGDAFGRCLKKHPEINLFSDDRHPTEEGTYLAACVFYLTIFEKSPIGLPNDLSLVDPKTGKTRHLMTIPTDVAAKLQQVANDSSG